MAPGWWRLNPQKTWGFSNTGRKFVSENRPFSSPKEMNHLNQPSIFRCKLAVGFRECNLRGEVVAFCEWHCSQRSTSLDMRKKSMECGVILTKFNPDVWHLHLLPYYAAASYSEIMYVVGSTLDVFSNNKLQRAICEVLCTWMLFFPLQSCETWMDGQILFLSSQTHPLQTKKKQWKGRLKKRPNCSFKQI